MERLENSRQRHCDVSKTGRTEKTHSDRANTHGVQGTMGWCRLQPWTVVGQWPLLRLQRPLRWMGRASSQRSTTGSCSHIREWIVSLCLLLPSLPFLGCSWSFPKCVSEQLNDLTWSRLRWSRRELATTSQDVWAAILTVMGWNRKRILTLFCLLNVLCIYKWRLALWEDEVGSHFWLDCRWRTTKIHSKFISTNETIFDSKAGCIQISHTLLTPL